MGSDSSDKRLSLELRSEACKEIQYFLLMVIAFVGVLYELHFLAVIFVVFMTPKNHDDIPDKEERACGRNNVLKPASVPHDSYFEEFQWNRPIDLTSQSASFKPEKNNFDFQNGDDSENVLDKFNCYQNPLYAVEDNDVPEIVLTNEEVDIGYDDCSRKSNELYPSKLLIEVGRAQETKIEHLIRHQPTVVDPPPQYFTIRTYCNTNIKLRIKYHDGKYPVMDYYVWEKLGRPRLQQTMITEKTVGMTGWIPVLVVDKPHLETEELDIYFGTNGKLPSEKFEQESLYSLARKEPIDGSAKLEEKVHPEKPKMIPEQEKRQPAKLENSPQIMNVRDIPQPSPTVPEKSKNVVVPQQTKQVLTENPPAPQYFVNILKNKLRIKFHDGKFPVIDYYVWEKLGRPRLQHTMKTEKAVPVRYVDNVDNCNIDNVSSFYNILGKLIARIEFKGKKGCWVPILVVNNPHLKMEELVIHFGVDGKHPGEKLEKVKESLFQALYSIASKGPIAYIAYNIKTKMEKWDEKVNKRK
ncbi:hypothetical protein DAPPUDRAFT_100248 [Daphnia pulex]|uniref:Uncharacterized protein n=1 Tax=Daphnia pulex TaxID=6669 RepID=E9G9V8_DAPPU|nr:hypothetical protein DAPPUDRAFT_100248 [Daphnia pulex]|eukprot:EFX83812.1 hypothetical protein DAPPUDRAFT_100248 [Daphnia pulex]